MASLYRIKLYGQSGDDPDVFARSLGALLRIETSLASALLERAPLVIRENLTQEEAEEVRGMIAAINGLCLVEPMNGAEERPSTPFPAKERQTAKETLLDLSTTNLIWFGLGAILLVVFFLGVFTLTPKLAVREKRPGSVLCLDQDPTRTAAARTALDSEAYEQTIQYLEQQVFAVEQEIPQLQQELMEVQRAQQLAASDGRDPNPIVAKESFLRSFEIRDEIQIKEHSLRAMRARLQALKRDQRLRTGPPSEK